MANYIESKEIELQKEYFEIAEQRIAFAEKDKTRLDSIASSKTNTEKKSNKLF